MRARHLRPPPCLFILALCVIGCTSAPSRPNEPPEIHQKEVDLQALVAMRDHRHAEYVTKEMGNAIEMLRIDITHERLAAQGHASLPPIPPPPTGAIANDVLFDAESTRWRMTIIETYEDAAIGASSLQEGAAPAQIADEVRGRFPEWLAYIGAHGTWLKTGTAEITARAQARVKTLDAAIQAKKSDPAMLQRWRAWWQALPAQLPVK